jgi:hypothetical protein
MQRIPPSEQLCKQLDELLDNGLAGRENLISTLVQLGAQLVVQQLLEQETTGQLGRGHYQHRRADEPLRGYRNGWHASLDGRRRKRVLVKIIGE